MRVSNIALILTSLLTMNAKADVFRCEDPYFGNFRMELKRLESPRLNAFLKMDGGDVFITGSGVLGQASPDPSRILKVTAPAICMDGSTVVEKAPFSNPVLNLTCRLRGTKETARLTVATNKGIQIDKPIPVANLTLKRVLEAGEDYISLEFDIISQQVHAYSSRRIPSAHCRVEE